MPVEQKPQIPQVEVTAITEQELLKPGAAKLVYKRVAELESENQTLRAQVESERAQREQLVREFHEADTRRQVLEERLRAFAPRNAYSQAIWGAIAILIGLTIDFVRAAKWGEVGLCGVALLLLGVAVLFANKAPQGPKAAQ